MKNEEKIKKYLKSQQTSLDDVSKEVASISTIADKTFDEVKNVYKNGAKSSNLIYLSEKEIKDDWARVYNQLPLNIDEYEQKLRETKRYQIEKQKLLDEFSELVLNDIKQASIFANTVIAERNELVNSRDFYSFKQYVDGKEKGQIHSDFNDDDIWKNKLKIDCQVQALIDIDFKKILNSELTKDVSLILGNIKAKLKVQDANLKPAEPSVVKSNIDGIITFKAKTKLMDYDSLARKTKLTKYLVKDIFDQLARRNYFEMVSANNNVNKVFSRDKMTMEEVHADPYFKELIVQLRIKNAISNLVASFSALNNPNTKVVARKLIENITDSSLLRKQKFNRMPTIEEGAVLQIDRLLKTVEQIVDEAVDSSEKHSNNFENSRTPKNFLNIWYCEFNSGKDLEVGLKYFGTALNSYVSTVVKELAEFAREYAKDKPKFDQNILEVVKDDY